MMELRKKTFAQIVQQVEEVGRLIDAIAVVAPTRIPILLLGPRSTGIDLMARALHTCSPRELRPFVSVRCGLYPGALLESRLFAGNVTSRAYVRSHSGRRSSSIESANGGTLFIDQVQNSTPLIQLELFRLMTDQEYIDPSRGELHRADVRIVASASMDLESKCERGQFRRDLFSRLNTVTLELRKGCGTKEWFLEVIDLLRDAALCQRGSLPMFPSMTLIPQILRHSWSSKVVAIQEAIREMTQESSEAPPAEVMFFDVLRTIGHRGAAHLAQHHLQAVNTAVERCVETHEFFGGRMYDTLVGQMQRTLIKRVMAQCNGAISRAACILGMSIQLLEAKLRELELQ
jgi:DNA-binding NtrC family response regulator